MGEAIGGHKVVIMDSNTMLDNKYYEELDNFKNERTEYDEGVANFIREGIDGVGEDDPNEEVDISVQSTELGNVVGPGLVDYSLSSSESEVESNSEPKNKPKRIIAYSTKKLLKMFNQRKASGDGTFKICPSLWKQLYIVMVKFGNSWIPVVYALLPDKCKETYFTFFYMVKKQIKDMKLTFNLDSIRTDFEVGAMKAAAAAWKVVPKGCYYHYTQGGWRYVQNHNMASAYLNDNDEEFKLLIKCILSLPHVPLNDVQETLDILGNREWDFNESVEKEAFKDKFIGYVRDFWVNGVIPPQVWNCFHRKVDLTNNNNESHNNYLNNALKEAHPSPAVLTVALVKELTLAETKLNKVKSGSQRVVKKTYLNLNNRRDNIKKMYHKMDRLEYLSQMGNIVMHIQLNKGQMAELRDTNAKNKNVEDKSDDDSEVSLQSTNTDAAPDDSNNEELASNDSERFNSTGGNATMSSEEDNHPYTGRRIGKAHGGKKPVEHEVPEYKGKHCLVCKGKFNVKSKYQMCKLCDRLVHVNNKKKCFKMNSFARDENYICILCKSHEEEHTSSNHEASGSGSSGSDNVSIDREYLEESGSDKNLNVTYIVDQPNGSENVEDLTIDGVTEGCADETGKESVEITTDSNQDDEEGTLDNSTFPCQICGKLFPNQRSLNEHLDSMHFESCPICERIFMTSIMKRKHIREDHTDSNISEEEFQQNIVRQSTLENTIENVLVEFVVDAEEIIVDQMKRRRRGAR